MALIALGIKESLKAHRSRIRNKKWNVTNDNFTNIISVIMYFCVPGIKNNLHGLYILINAKDNYIIYVMKLVRRINM